MTSLLTDLSSPSCCFCRSPWPPPSLPPPGWPPPRGTRCSSSTSWSYAWASSPPGGGPLTGPKLGARQPSAKAGSGHWSAGSAALAYWSFKGPATARPPKWSEAHPQVPDKPGTQDSTYLGTLQLQVYVGNLYGFRLLLHIDGNTWWDAEACWSSPSGQSCCMPSQSTDTAINAQKVEPSQKAHNNQRPTIRGMQPFIKRSLAQNEVMNYSSSNICHELCSVNQHKLQRKWFLGKMQIRYILPVISHFDLFQSRRTVVKLIMKDILQWLEKTCMELVLSSDTLYMVSKCLLFGRGCQPNIIDWCALYESVLFGHKWCA